MNSTTLQSALREWTMLISAPRLWATFAIVVSVFVAIGPSGTMEDMGVLERAAFWTLLHGAAWTIAIVVITLTEISFAGRLHSTPLLLAINALIAAPFVAAAVELIRWSWLGSAPSLPAYGRQLVVCLPLSVLFSLLTHLTLSATTPEPKSGSDATAALKPPNDAAEPAPLTARLKPEMRGPLLHLTVEDHYTVVTTTRGRQLLLLRFSDALREIGATDGVQTHRSHWVAASHVTGLERDGSRLFLRLTSGATVPVSRSFTETVRKRFGRS